MVWGSCRCVFPALLLFSALSFYEWALKTLGVVFILRSSLWVCCNTWNSQSAVLTNPMVMPSPKSASTKWFQSLFWTLTFMFLCLVHNPHPLWLQQLSSWFLSQILFLSPSPGYVSCFSCLSHSNACSSWCDAGLERETHSVLLWDKKVFDFYREVSALLFSLCFLPRKVLSWKFVETQEQHLLGGAKLSFALFASPSCSLDCCSPSCLFPGSGFLLDKPFTASYTMALHLSLYLQWLLSKPVLFLSGIQSAVLMSHLACVQGCYFRTLNVKNFWDYLVIGNKVVINTT